MDMKIIPRLSEKSYAHSQNSSYVFDVPTTASKQEIARSVAQQFNVQVHTVNTIVAKGKVKKSYRKGGSPVIGKRKTIKKAYVRLAEGQTIPVFAAMESETAAKKQGAAPKAGEKK